MCIFETLKYDDFDLRNYKIQEFFISFGLRLNLFKSSQKKINKKSCIKGYNLYE